jgi:hypothetical protein
VVLHEGATISGDVWTPVACGRSRCTAVGRPPGLSVSGCFLDDLDGRAQAQFDVDVGDVGLHRADKNNRDAMPRGAPARTCLTLHRFQQRLAAMLGQTMPLLL